MAMLKMDYEMTRSIGNQIKEKTESFNSLLSEIKNINNNLKVVWEGRDEAKYSNAVIEQAKVMDELSAIMESIGNFIVSVAQIMEETQSANASSINI